MNGNEQILLEAVFGIQKDIQGVKVDIETLRGEIHKNNGIKDMVLSNSKSLSNCSKLLGDHLLSCQVQEKQEAKNVTRVKWIVPVGISVMALVLTGLGYILK